MILQIKQRQLRLPLRYLCNIAEAFVGIVDHTALFARGVKDTHQFIIVGTVHFIRVAVSVRKGRIGVIHTTVGISRF